MQTKPGIFEVEEGAYFRVHLYKDHVVKFPKKETKRTSAHDPQILAEIAEIQTELSKKIPEVLPCEKRGMTLVMPRARGILGESLPREKWQEVKDRLNVIEEYGQRLGFKMEDLSRKNVIYDTATDRMFIIDGHLFKRVGD